MQLSDRTIKILKNWTQIHEGLIIRDGSDQITMSNDKTIFAKATFDETFPRLCGIVNLTAFVSALDSFKTPEVRFEEKAAYIALDNMSLKYVYCQPDIVLPGYEKYTADRLKFSANAIEIHVSASEWAHLRKGMSLFSLPDLVVQWDGSKLQLIGTDIKDDSSNRVVLSAIPNAPIANPFAVSFNADNIHKLFDGAYVVRIALGTKGQIGQFECLDQKVQYFVGSEAMKEPIALKEE